MIPRAIVCIAFLLFAIAAPGQKVEQPIGPEREGGVEQLAAIFDRIRLSDSEVRASRHLPIALIFKVSASGELKLIDVSRLESASLRDSLFSRKDSLPRFKPKLVDGQPQPSLFGLRYSYREDYTILEEHEVWFYSAKVRPRNKHVSQYEIGSRDLWGRIEVGPNIFNDGAGEYLHPGAGIGFEVGIPRQKVDHAYVIGLDNFFNRKRAALPLDTDRAQRNTVHTVVYHVGYAIASGHNRFTPSVNYMSANLVRRESGERSIDDDRWGLGVTYTRLFPVFKDAFKFNEGASLNKYYLSMSFRPSYYFSGSTVFGSGLMFNLYFGIAFQDFSLREYKLREEYYERF